MHNKFFILFHFFLVNIGIYAAPLENIPVHLIQPDGTKFLCFASGDEYCNWIHDKYGNIIIKDSISNYYCYITEQSDSLIHVSQNHNGSILKKYLPIMRTIRDRSIQMYNKSTSTPYKFSLPKSKSFQTINNIVIFVSFADQDDYSETTINSIKSLYSDSISYANSVKQYYWESSYHQLKVNSLFFPTTTNIFSYKDIHPRNYYCKYSETNTIGYSTNGNARKIREDSLLVRAMTFVRNQIPSNINLDTDNDGKVDNVCFIVKGGTTDWNTLLWPHKWDLWSIFEINGKRVSNYNFQLSDYTISHGVGVLCHEFGHTLGLPDLYHGYKDTIYNVTWNPIGVWDIMASNGYYPQQTSIYMKNKYLHWLDTIPEIKTSGKYYMYNNLAYQQQGYKIPIYNSDEYLFVEYRNKNQHYDMTLPNSGLLIYRINPDKDGNFRAIEGGGKNDEIYVYRPNGNFVSNGNISLAPFCTELGNTNFNESTNPEQFLSDGSYGNIYISNVSNCDSVITFDVKICNPNNISYSNNCNIPEYTNGKTITATNVTINGDAVFEASESINLSYGFQTTIGATFEAIIKPCE